MAEIVPADEGSNPPVEFVEPAMARSLFDIVRIHDRSQLRAYVCRLRLGQLFEPLTADVGVGTAGKAQLKEQRREFLRIVQQSTFLRKTTLADLEMWCRLSKSVVSLGLSFEDLDALISSTGSDRKAMETFNKMSHDAAHLFDLLESNAATLRLTGL